jgi:hypothetical protein
MPYDRFAEHDGASGSGRLGLAITGNGDLADRYRGRFAPLAQPVVAGLIS